MKVRRHRLDGAIYSDGAGIYEREKKVLDSGVVIFFYVRERAFDLLLVIGSVHL